MQKLFPLTLLNPARVYPRNERDFNLIKSLFTQVSDAKRSHSMHKKTLNNTSKPYLTFQHDGTSNDGAQMNFRRRTFLCNFLNGFIEFLCE